MINFFASWCDPCRDEMPLLNELARRADERGYRLLGVAVEDTRAFVVQFVQAAKIAFPVALDTNSRVKRAYRIFGPPATFFVDAGGDDPRHRARRLCSSSRPPVEVYRVRDT